MAPQALYRKWRPTSFDEVVGQEHVIRTLRNAITSGRIHHAHLFAGPRGTGKTTTARLLAKAVNCLAPEEQRPCNQCAICEAVNEGRLIDLIEIDAASNTGVDDVRELRERVGFRPNEARYKVYVIDEVHMLSNAAFNALLKTLEEPPPHVIFVLATTEVQKIPPTVLSRCQRFDFRRIPLTDIVARLRWLATQEGLQVDDGALWLIARQATGSLRDAESLLDQLASFNREGLSAEEVRTALGAGADEIVNTLIDALARGDLAQGLDTINTAVDQGADPRRFARQVVEHLRALLHLQLKSGVLPAYVTDDMRPRLEEQASAMPSELLTRAIRRFHEVASETAASWQPQLPLELALVETVLRADAPANPTARTQAPPTAARQASSTRPSVPAPRPSIAAAAAPADSDVVAGAPVRETPVSYQSSVLAGEPLTVESLQRHWSEFLSALRPRNLRLEGLIRCGEPVAVEDEVVVLGFAHDLHRCKVEEERNKQDVEDALSDLAGRRQRVRCVLLQQSNASEPAAPETPAPPSEPSFDDDPLVRAAEGLGAKVVRRRKS
ncbi:MAG: DNA polymerase III subunit gamma/tau [Anaerolineales bacterium]|nr:DNA polymerase III subunit gamma/tau [Anaerolineales bacterium]